VKPNPTPVQPDGRHDLAFIYAVGLLALLPLIVFHHQFGQLFWFGDDWDQLDQIQRTGFWTWTWQVFAENFVPLFKLLWGGCVFLFRGNYFCMIVVLWLTHAVNTIQLGRLLRLYGFPLVAVLASQIAFGLTPGNLETLGWATQWSAVLATSFLLFALEWLQHISPFVSHSKGTAWRAVAVVVFLSTCSALSFSRGVLTGALLALVCFWPTEHSMPFFRRSLQAALFVLPAIAAAALIMVFASGNHQHLKGHLLDATDFALWYFCLNPFYRLVEMDSWGIRTLVLFGILKVVVLAWGLLCSDRRQRRLLVLLLLYELSNAALLGIGRYHTGLPASISSRYQYSSLLAVLPFAALCLNDIQRRIPQANRRPALVTLGILLLLFAGVCHRWRGEIKGFSETRGTETRTIIFTNSHPAEMGAIPGIPFLSTARAKELALLYHLN